MILRAPPTNLLQVNPHLGVNIPLYQDKPHWPLQRTHMFTACFVSALIFPSVPLVPYKIHLWPLAFIGSSINGHALGFQAPASKWCLLVTKVLMNANALASMDRLIRDLPV